MCGGCVCTALRTSRWKWPLRLHAACCAANSTSQVTDREVTWHPFPLRKCPDVSHMALLLRSHRENRCWPSRTLWAPADLPFPTPRTHSLQVHVRERQREAERQRREETETEKGSVYAKASVWPQPSTCLVPGCGRAENLARDQCFTWSGRRLESRHHSRPKLNNNDSQNNTGLLCAWSL